MSINKEIPNNNGAVFTISKLIKAVMSSAAEAGLGGTFRQLQRNYPSTPRTIVNGEHTTTDINEDIQYNCTWQGY